MKAVQTERPAAPAAMAADAAASIKQWRTIVPSNIPTQYPPMSGEIKRGMNALEAAVNAIEGEVAFAQAILERLISQAYLGDVVDGYGNQSGPTQSDFAPWYDYNSRAIKAAGGFSAALREIYAQASIAYAFAAGRIFVLAYADEILTQDDLRWPESLDLTCSGLKVAFQSISPPSLTSRDRETILQIYTEASTTLDDLFDDVRFGESEPIMEFARRYSPDPAENCFKQFRVYGSHVHRHLEKIQEQNAGSV